MAEAVHAQLEEMVPELHDFEQRGIFSKGEIKQIVKKRTAFEYALRRRQPEKRDFLRYIEYELNLDLLRRKRRERLGIVRKNTTSEFAIQRRIHFIFHRAEQKFKGDVSLWLQHIDFCKRTGAARMLGKVFAQALQFHPRNASLWVLAAKWDFEETGNVNTARVLMQRGIRLNPDSHLLWREYFRMELTYVERLRARRKLLGIAPKDAAADGANGAASALDIPAVSGESNAPLPAAPATPMDALLSGAIPRVVYKNAIAALPRDLSLRQSLAEVCLAFPDDSEILDAIYADILRDFEGVAAARVFVAVRPYYTAKAAVAALSSAQSEEVVAPPKAALLAAERTAAKNLEAAASAVGTPAVYEEGCKFHLQVLAGTSSSGDKGALEGAEGGEAVDRARADFHVGCILNLCSVAAEKGLASDWLLTTRVSALLDVGEIAKALECAREATDGVRGKEKARAASTAVWMDRLRLEITEAAAHGNTKTFVDGVHKAFARAVSSLDVRGQAEVYSLWVEYCIAAGDATRTSECFEAAVKLHGNAEVTAVAAALRMRYIEWACIVGGIERAREVYTRMLAMLSVPLDLYIKCIEVENAQPAPNRARVMQLFEAAVTAYGSNNADLWLDYISSELSHGQAANVGTLYWRALKHLDDASEFVQRYNLLRVAGGTA